MPFDATGPTPRDARAAERAAVREALEAWVARRVPGARTLVLLVPRRRGLGLRAAGAYDAHHWHRAPQHLVLGFDLDLPGAAGPGAAALGRVLLAHGRRQALLSAWEHLPLTRRLRRVTLAPGQVAPLQGWVAPAIRPQAGLRVVGWWEHRGSARGGGRPPVMAGVYCVCPAGHRVALRWRRDDLRFEPGEDLSVPCPGC